MASNRMITESSTFENGGHKRLQSATVARMDNEDEHEHERFVAAIAATIAAERKHQRYTQAELATRAGMHRVTLNRIESGQRTGYVDAAQLRQIAKALGMDLPSFIEEVERWMLLL